MFNDPQNLLIDLAATLGLTKFADIGSYQSERMVRSNEAKEAMEPHIKGEMCALTKEVRPYESAMFLHFREKIHRSKTAPLLRKAVNGVNSLIIERIQYRANQSVMELLKGKNFDGSTFDEWIKEHFYRKRIADPNALIGFRQIPTIDQQQASSRPTLSLEMCSSKHVLECSSKFALIKRKLSEFERGHQLLTNSERPIKADEQAFWFFGRNFDAVIVMVKGVPQVESLIQHGNGIVGFCPVGGEIDGRFFKSDFDFAVPQMDLLDSLASASATIDTTTGTSILVHKEMQCGVCGGDKTTPKLDASGTQLYEETLNSLGEAVRVPATQSCGNCQGTGVVSPFASNHIVVPRQETITGQDQNNATDLVKSLMGFIQSPTDNAKYLSERETTEYKKTQDLLNIMATNLNFAQSAESKQESRREKEEMLITIGQGIEAVYKHLLAVATAFYSFANLPVRGEMMQEIAVMMPTQYLQMDAAEVENMYRANLPNMSLQERDTRGRAVEKTNRPNQEAQVDLYYNAAWELSNGYWLATTDEMATLAALGILTTRDKIAATKGAGFLYSLVFMQQEDNLNVLLQRANAYIDQQAQAQAANMLPLTDANAI